MEQNLFQMVMLTYLHIPYIWGGDDPINGVDCSGLVQELLAVLGLDPKGDQTAQVLYDYFSKPGMFVEGGHKTGTLYFFGKSKDKITHIAMGFDEFTYLEAGGGGSKTLNRQDAINQNAYTRLRPNNSRSDLVAILNPKGLTW